jgi:addiction module HigA family antidote
MTERTFSIIKPDATRRNLTGKVNAVIEDAGLRIIAQKRIRMSQAQAEKFYEIHKERRGITAETDLHLCAYLGLEPGYWLRTQLAYDLREAVNTIGPKVKASIKPLQAA